MRRPAPGRTLGEIYLTLAPPIVAGIANMAWVKTPWLANVGPIDGGRRWSDGRDLLGPHKTWKGLAGMVALGGLAGLGLGSAQRGRAVEQYNLFFSRVPNTPAWSATTGALLGLGYALAELPNSFLKRRLGVQSGRMHAGPAKWALVLLDQVDSVLGCLAVLACFRRPSLRWSLAAAAVGAGTHAGLNLALYRVGLRKNPL